MGDSRPLRQLCRIISFHSPSSNSFRRSSLRMLFLYFFSFLSKIVYLSFGTISCSTGISSFHLSTAFVVIPCFDKALSTTATTLSTARNRLRCRAFWNLESRHGIFLHTQFCQPNAPKFTIEETIGGTYHRRPPDNTFVGLNAPNIVLVLNTKI